MPLQTLARLAPAIADLGARRATVSFRLCFNRAAFEFPSKVRNLPGSFSSPGYCFFAPAHARRRSSPQSVAARPYPASISRTRPSRSLRGLSRKLLDQSPSRIEFRSAKTATPANFRPCTAARRHSAAAPPPPLPWIVGSRSSGPDMIRTIAVRSDINGPDLIQPSQTVIPVNPSTLCKRDPRFHENQPAVHAR